MNAVAINELSKLNATPDVVFKKALIYFGVGLGVLIVIFIVYKIYKGLQQAPEKRDWKDEIDKGNLTHDASKYKEFAGGIYTAFTQWYGEDESTIFRILSYLNTSDDWLQLKLVYDVKDGMTLTQWINKYFSDSEIAEVNKILGKFNESI